MAEGNGNGGRVTNWLLGAVFALLAAAVPTLISMYADLKLIQYRLMVLESAFSRVHPEAVNKVDK